MLRRLRPEDTVPVRLTLLHGYVGFLPAVGLILGAAAIAPLVGIHQGHDLVYTSRGWIFLLACFIVGGSLYRAMLGLAGREWRALVRRLEVADPPAHGANGAPSFP